jgi:hypothetical protein
MRGRSLTLGESRSCTRCGEFKPFADFPLCRGKLRARCKPCHTQQAIEWQNDNPEKARERKKRWQVINNPPAHFGPPCPKHLRPKKPTWASLNPERQRVHQKRWADANKEVGRARVRRRQARQLQAVPAWADTDLMRDFYSLAAIWTEATGEAYEVDHLVPLISDRVCGLHCQANLSILTKRENVQKGNRHWPDMP